VRVFLLIKKISGDFFSWQPKKNLVQLIHKNFVKRNPKLLDLEDTLMFFSESTIFKQTLSSSSNWPKYRRILQNFLPVAKFG